MPTAPLRLSVAAMGPALEHCKVAAVTKHDKLTCSLHLLTECMPKQLYLAMRVSHV